jgi:hypothetical protein
MSAFPRLRSSFALQQNFVMCQEETFRCLDFLKAVGIAARLATEGSFKLKIVLPK